MSQSTIDVRGLYISYAGKEVLHDINFSFPTGKLIGIIGPNGAGKSTLMKAMLGLIPHSRGDVTIANQPIKRIRKQIAYVPQRANIDWDFPILVKDTVLLGTFPHLPLFRRPTKKHKEWAMECLTQVGMESFHNNQIGELSGGQQQRVFLARALAQRADYFFLDEPFVGVDMASEEIIIKMLKQLRNEGRTVFVVHHDLNKVNDYFDDLILINKEIIASGPVDRVMQPDMMQRAYQTRFQMMSTLGVGI